MIPVEISRVPLTTPCPVPVMPSTGETMRDGEPIPIEQRTELCAVDAGWMIGAQRICDVHLREACELLGIDFDGVVREAYEPYGPEAVERALAQSARPWHQRSRYAQPTARDWHDSAKEHGLA